MLSGLIGTQQVDMQETFLTFFLLQVNEINNYT